LPINYFMLTVAHLMKKFPTFYGTRMFITALTRASTGPFLEPNKSNPRASTLIVIVTYHSCVGLPGGLFL
jgi:hypothetical protein